ncbi:MAG: hypothetical protein ACI4S9_07340, partial [Christensenellales bacterium]
VGQNTVGDVLSEHNTIPYGYIDYSVSVDGEVFDTEKLLAEAARFYRSNDIKSAEVTNGFILGKRLKVEITTFIPYGTEAVCFAVRLKNYDFMFPHCSKTYHVKFDFALNLKTRKGNRIYDKTEFRDGTVDTEVRGHELYRNKIKVSATNGSVEFDGDVVRVSSETDVCEEWKELKFMFDFGGEYTVFDTDKLRDSNRSEWRSFYERNAIVSTENTDEIFMYNNSLYLLHMGFNPDYGFPIGHPFNFPWYWQQSVFWDMHFLADGMLRSNDRETVVRLTEYLKRSMRAEGKPFPWMMIYDGTTFLDDKRDIAPLVISAHAMTAIKLYEHTQDSDMLKNLCYPIVDRCCDYAKNELFRRESDGRFIIGKPVSNDVVEEEGEEINQTFTTLWFISVIAKFIEYSDMLGISIDPVYCEIIDNFKLEKDDEEYLHCRGYKAKDFKWASWIPFLAYPTEGVRFLDEDLLRKTREKYSFVELYQDKQNCYQPWTECIEAQAAHRTGENERAYKLLRTALTHVFGDGYFSEVGPLRQTGAYPPYISAHGAYVAAFLDTFAASSIWEKKLELFTNMPSDLENQRIFIGGAGISCAKNVVIKRAEYSPFHVQAELEGNLRGVTTKIRLPKLMSEEDICLFVNGRKTECEVNLRRRYLSFTLECDSAVVEIR